MIYATLHAGIILLIIPSIPGLDQYTLIHNSTITFFLDFLKIGHLEESILLQIFILYISSVDRPFSDRVGLPPITLPIQGFNEEYWSRGFRPDALPDVNHMCGM